MSSETLAKSTNALNAPKDCISNALKRMYAKKKSMKWTKSHLIINDLRIKHEEFIH